MDSLSTAKTLISNSSKSMFNAAETAIDDVEISIFDAEKYFNEELNDIKRQQQVEKEPSDHDLLSLQRSSSSLSSPAEFDRKKSLRGATPSEASWTSQTALLAKTVAASKRWSATKKWLLRRNCCCSNGKSIRVKEAIITSDSDHTRPIVLMDTVKTSSINPKTLHADDNRSHKPDSIVEIHQIRATEAPRQQRISAAGRPFINAIVGFTFPILNSAGKEDDVGSDASSDLFEIETFSAQTTSCPIYCMCDSVGGDSNGERKLTPANCVNSGNLSRLSVSADECRPVAAADGCDGELEESVAALRPPQEESGGGEGRRTSDGGVTQVSCRPAVAEGPVLLRVGGRAEKAWRGSLVAAGG